jgi:hypothetical protein
MNIEKKRPFEKYLNKYFVESGTNVGEGIDSALKAGFEKILSYEIYEPLYKEAKLKYANNSSVSLYNKSSLKMWDEVQFINEPITFWLDGHWSGDGTGYDTDMLYPLLKELEIIRDHPIKTHTILIDDRRLMRKYIEPGEKDHDIIGISEAEIIEALYDINPSYEISYDWGYIEDDIIVAKIAC